MPNTMIKRTYITIEDIETRAAMLRELLSNRENNFITDRTAMPDDFILVEGGRVLEVTGKAFACDIPAIRMEAFPDGHIPTTGTVNTQLDGNPWVEFSSYALLSDSGREIVSRYAGCDLGPAPSFQSWRERQERVRELREETLAMYLKHVHDELQPFAEDDDFDSVIDAGSDDITDADCEPCCCSIRDIVE